MSDTRDSPRARHEAAAWFARLKRRAVTTASLRAFRDWRQEPDNAAAYRSVETAWSAAGGLADDPEIRAATRAALARRPLRARIRDALSDHPRLAWGLGGLACAALILGATGPVLLQPTYATATGEQRLVILKDGSRVRLNTDSKVRVRFSGRERHVDLVRGEAFFEAAHDASRPFLVDAGRADVRALGTRFDVRRDDGRVQVTLVEGKVRVRQDGKAQAFTLAPSQQIVLDPGRAAAPEPADTARLTSWTTGRLIFHETPLAEAVAEVNRYAGQKIALDDAALGAAPVSGVFDTGDTRAFLAAVSRLFDLTAAPGPDGRTVLKRRAA